MSQRIKEIDGLRGIAALSVVFYHYFFRYDVLFGHENIVSSWAVYGKHGVELFFIISGFVIFWSLNNTKKPKDFLISRFSRLYPVFWAALIVTFLCVSYFGLINREVSTMSFFGNFLMFHSYFNIPSVDGVYWTLKVELTFYALIFLLYVFRLLNKIDYFILIGLCFIIVTRLGISQIPDVIAKVEVLQWFPFFAIGISLYKIHFKTFEKLTIVNLFLAIASTALIFSIAACIMYGAFVCLFYLAVNKYLPLLKSRILLFFGAISYVLYLIHQNVGYIIIREAYAYNVPPIFTIILALAIVVIVSYLLHENVEKPLGKAIKAKFLKSKK